LVVSNAVDIKVIKRDISGKVWIDSNKNGAQDAGEAVKSGVTVNLIDIATGQVAATTTTDSSGAYSFKDLPAGTYEVTYNGIDRTRYNIAEYQAAGVGEDKNSDGINAPGTVISTDEYILPTALATAQTGNTSYSVTNVDLGLTVIPTASKTANPADGTGITKGSQITYSITVNNPENAAISNVVVTDTVPAGTAYVSSDNGGTEAAGIITWNLSIPANGSITVHFAADVTAANGNIENTAKVDGVDTNTVSNPIVLPEYKITEIYKDEAGNILSGEIDTTKKQGDMFRGNSKDIPGYTIIGYTMDGGSMKQGIPSIADVEKDSNIVYIYKKVAPPVIPVIPEPQPPAAKTAEVPEMQTPAVQAKTPEEKQELPLPKTGESDSYLYKILIGGVAIISGAIGYEVLRKRKNDE